MKPEYWLVREYRGTGETLNFRDYIYYDVDRAEEAFGRFWSNDLLDITGTMDGLRQSTLKKSLQRKRKYFAKIRLAFLAMTGW